MIKGLKYIGPLEKYETIITENPIEEIWHLIDFFTSEETIAECTPPVSKDLVPFICESIVQAEEFKSSSSLSGEHTKPLLLYYCLHNLTKAVLALENNCKPAGYHGLKKVEIPSTNDLLDVSVHLDEGVFWDLLILKNITPQKDLKITLDEMLKRCGYIIREYELAYRRKTEIIIPELDASISLNKLEIVIIPPNKDFIKDWKKFLPQLEKYFELTEFTKGYLTYTLKQEAPKDNLNAVQKVLSEVLTYSVFENPRYFLVPITNIDYFWPQEAYLYALSFILGSLVRYYPDYWYQNVIGNKRNRWLIRKLNSVIERVYPNLMVNIIFNSKFYRFVTATF